MKIERAKEIMGKQFIGPDELLRCTPYLLFDIPAEIPSIPYDEDKLKESKEDYFLILGVAKFTDGKDVTCRNLIDIFGKDPEVSEPCFYNQEWYEQEDFINNPMETGWYLIRKDVLEDSRAVLPAELMKIVVLPTTICCAYSFFVAWLSTGERLWYHDYVWCSNLDHNGDRIYVGKYHDVDGVNKNGFSIHRHLALRLCYGATDYK